MNNYMFLMHDEPPQTGDFDSRYDWQPYLAKLRTSGRLIGGSAIGTGMCVSKSGVAREITAHLSGFIRVQAVSIDEARTLLEGNPVYEAGGTVEIRELPQTR
jgi:hypothetical protein